MDCGENSDGNQPRSLLDFAAEAVGKVHRPYTIVGHELALDENMFKRVLFWSFPQSLSWLKLMSKSCSTTGNPDDINIIKEIYQIGFYITAKLEDSREIQVNIEFERQTPLSYSCSWCSNLCKHIRLVMKYRIENADKIEIYLPLPETLMKQDVESLRKIIMQFIKCDSGAMLRRFCGTLEDSKNECETDEYATDPTVPENDDNYLPKILQNKLKEFEQIKNSLREYTLKDRKSTDLYSFVNKLYQIASICGIQMANAFAIELIRTASGVEFLFYDVETNLSYFVKDVVNVLVAINLFATNKDFKIVEIIHEIIASKRNYQHMENSTWIDMPVISPIFKETVKGIYHNLDLEENDPLYELAAALVVPHTDIYSEEPLPIMLRRAEKITKDAMESEDSTVQVLETVEYLKKILMSLIASTQNHSILYTFISEGHGYSGELIVFISELNKIWTFSKGKGNSQAKTKRRKCPPRIGISRKRGKFDYSVELLVDASDGDTENYLDMPLDLSTHFEEFPDLDMCNDPTLNYTKNDDFASMIEHEVFTTETSGNTLFDHASGENTDIEKLFNMDTTVATSVQNGMESCWQYDPTKPSTSFSSSYPKTTEKAEETLGQEDEYYVTIGDGTKLAQNPADDTKLAQNHTDEHALNFTDDVMTEHILPSACINGECTLSIPEHTDVTGNDTVIDLSVMKMECQRSGIDSVETLNGNNVSLKEVESDSQGYLCHNAHPGSNFYETYREDIQKENIFACFVQTLLQLSRIKALLPEDFDNHTSVIYQLSMFFCLEMSRFHHDTPRSNITEGERKMVQKLESGIRQQIHSDGSTFTSIYVTYKSILCKTLSVESYGEFIPYVLINTLLEIAGDEEVRTQYQVSNQNTIIEIFYVSVKIIGALEKEAKDLHETTLDAYKQLCKNWIKLLDCKPFDHVEHTIKVLTVLKDARNTPFLNVFSEHLNKLKSKFSANERVCTAILEFFIQKASLREQSKCTSYTESLLIQDISEKLGLYALGLLENRWKEVIKDYHFYEVLLRISDDFRKDTSPEFCPNILFNCIVDLYNHRASGTRSDDWELLFMFDRPIYNYHGRFDEIMGCIAENADNFYSSGLAKLIEKYMAKSNGSVSEEIWKIVNSRIHKDDTSVECFVALVQNSPDTEKVYNLCKIVRMMLDAPDVKTNRFCAFFKKIGMDIYVLTEETIQQMKDLIQRNGKMYYESLCCVANTNPKIRRFIDEFNDDRKSYFKLFRHDVYDDVVQYLVKHFKRRKRIVNALRNIPALTN